MDKDHSDSTYTMKNINTFINMETPRTGWERRPSIFDGSSEKGSHEWRTFNVVNDDPINAYHVHVPTRAIVTAQEHNVLRIAYPSIRALREM